jgi:hypothetical protein
MFRIVTFRERSAGDHFDMVDPIEIQRRIRRRIDRAGLRADLAADVNIAVSTGGGTTTVRQDAPIHQGRSTRATRDAPDPKEQP